MHTEAMSNYSRLITPEKYIHLMTEQHLFIKRSDYVILEFLREIIMTQNRPNNILEIGSGPMRISQKIYDLLQDFSFNLLELDQNFVEYSASIIHDRDMDIKIIQSDAATFRTNQEVDIAISQGFHHHINSGYLENLYDNLTPEGYYIVGDEFLASYNNEHQRKVNAIIWYSYIITNAIKSGYNDLAREEVKTLLDDINSDKTTSYKTEELIHKVTLECQKINQNIKPTPLANQLLDFIESETSLSLASKKNHDPNIPEAMFLSRGDRKISREVFEGQVQSYGFRIIKSKRIGNSKGSLTVYLLQK